MNRDQLIDAAIKAATNDIDEGDESSLDDEFRCRCYLGAIAKLMLAQALSRDATASRPRITDASEWLPGDPL